jgi:4'-phosphopantetheinyl transferase
VLAGVCHDLFVATVVIRERGVVEDDAHRALLDEVEAMRVARKREPVAFVAAHALQRETIGDHLDVDPAELRFTRRCATCGSDRHGKPSIVGIPGWSYSLSYTNSLAVVALTDAGEVGVDIESVVEADHTGFDEVTLSPEERPGFSGFTDGELAAARATVWARKEAVLKATGHGLVVDPSEVVVSAPGAPAELLAWRAHEEGPDHLQLEDLVLKDSAHRGAVAVLTAEPLSIVHET